MSLLSSAGVGHVGQDDLGVLVAQHRGAARGLGPEQVEYEAYDQAMLLDDLEFDGIDECLLCGERSVYEDVCYNCESCMVCMMEDQYCQCQLAMGEIHSMTDEEFKEQMPL